jgi:hypothetical protein
MVFRYVVGLSLVLNFSLVNLYLENFWIYEYCIKQDLLG